MSNKPKYVSCTSCTTCKLFTAKYLTPQEISISCIMQENTEFIVKRAEDYDQLEEHCPFNNQGCIVFGKRISDPPDELLADELPVQGLDAYDGLNCTTINGKEPNDPHSFLSMKSQLTWLTSLTDDMSY
jgi:hypothetical protein